MRKFALLKDILTPTITIKAGAIFKQEIPGGAYWYEKHHLGYNNEDVELRPDWFEEIKEKKWTDFDMKLFLSTFADAFVQSNGATQSFLDRFMQKKQ